MIIVINKKDRDKFKFQCIKKNRKKLITTTIIINKITKKYKAKLELTKEMANYIPGKRALIRLYVYI